MSNRNFWISADIEGRKTKLEGGPRSKDGGFTLSIKQMVNGERMEVLNIEGFALDSKLITFINNRMTGDVSKIESQR